ncbi:STAS domain protein [Leptospira langatensis]|uniref:STAS domain protein n=1 Tax=Leptospira langatensis TaxID=2484983 RepID=A0A5F1ZQ44_9LEPT|nr:anti-sigma factor antagonist [Leptospira langatensis]TGK01848.1 STAS domain protein [Leptospira langatensis]TGL39453.1 STAS domain protein [Leptospira langatensis]
MKELIVNLQGKLDSILGSTFREKTDDVLHNIPHRILLDARELQDWDEAGLTSLKNSSLSHATSIYAACSLSEALTKDWDRLGVSSTIPYFTTREEAKAYLLSAKSDGQQTQVVESTAACPACLQILRVRGKGNYRCPACSHTFYLTADYRTASYEKLF